MTEHLPTRVETSAGVSRGQTVVDRRTLQGEDEVHGTALPTHSVDVALGIDAAYYTDMFATALLGTS